MMIRYHYDPETGTCFPIQEEDKCKTDGKWKFTKGLFEGRIIIPFDGEELNLAPWSHGFTCFKDAESGEYLGWCGINYFQDNTTPAE